MILQLLRDDLILWSGEMQNGATYISVHSIDLIVLP